MPHMGKGNGSRSSGSSFLMSCFIWAGTATQKSSSNGWNANHSSFGKKNKVMTATIWHRHDRLKNNEEGFFFPTPNCPSSSAIQYVDAWNVNLEVHVTTWLTLEQKNWHNSVMPENWRLLTTPIQGLRTLLDTVWKSLQNVSLRFTSEASYVYF